MGVLVKVQFGCFVGVICGYGDMGAVGGAVAFERVVEWSVLLAVECGSNIEARYEAFVVFPSMCVK